MSPASCHWVILYVDWDPVSDWDFLRSVQLPWLFKLFISWTLIKLSKRKAEPAYISNIFGLLFPSNKNVRQKSLKFLKISLISVPCNQTGNLICSTSTLATLSPPPPPSSSHSSQPWEIRRQATHSHGVIWFPPKCPHLCTTCSCQALVVTLSKQTT